jgi:hypothetical protein
MGNMIQVLFVTDIEPISIEPISNAILPVLIQIIEKMAAILKLLATPLAHEKINVANTF